MKIIRLSNSKYSVLLGLLKDLKVMCATNYIQAIRGGDYAKEIDSLEDLREVADITLDIKTSMNQEDFVKRVKKGEFK